MFEIGDLIRFKYTGVEAEIVEDHMDGSYTVWIEADDDESVAFVDDIVLAKDFKQIEISAQRKAVKKKTKGPSTEDLFFSKSEQEHRKKVALQPPHLKKSVAKSTTNNTTEEETGFKITPIEPTAPTQTGCHLAFHRTSPTNYTVYLVNDTPISFNFEFKLFLRKEIKQGFNKLIPANTFFAIGELLHEQFNDSPHIEFSCPTFKFEKSIKLKYRKFAGTHKMVPLMGLSTYSFLLFKNLTPFHPKPKASIQSYTQQHKNEQAHIIAPVQKLYKRFDLNDVAAFEPELDLHAEKLVNDTSEFTSGELYNIQLKVLQSFINKAVEFGIKEVFVIHGLGKGKLRQGVDEYLRYHGNVKSYKNEFHEKYGFGATKVILKQ